MVDRARRMLFEPRAAWASLAAAPPPVGETLRSWLLPLLVLGAVATFVGQWLFGTAFAGVRVRPGVVGSLQIALVGFVLSLVACFVIAAIANVLAPVLGGRKQYDRAFALVAFGSAGALVGNLAAIVPALWIVAVVGALYSLYLIHRGIVPMMAIAPGRRIAYLLLLLLCGGLSTMVLAIGLGAVSNGLGRGLYSGGTVTIETPGGAVTRSQGEIDTLNRRLEEAARRMEQAHRSGDGAGVASGIGDALKAVTAAAPAGERKPVPSRSLKDWLPSTLAGLERTDFEVNDGQALGIGGSMARARYGSGAHTVELEIVDAGGAAGVLALVAGLVQGERETATETERSYPVGKRKIFEKQRKDGSYSERTTILANGVMVRAEARGLGGDALQAALEKLDLARLERP
jgi:hypothetical protein